MFPTNERTHFALAVEALHKRFTVDIKELRGLEFRRKAQLDDESVEHLRRPRTAASG